MTLCEDIAEMEIQMIIRTYSELIRIPTFEERYNYLKLDSEIGIETFGFERYLNQRFYRSKEWKSLRDEIIEIGRASCRERVWHSV